MHSHGVDLSTCHALIVDSSANMRAILRTQLRDIGVGTVTQVPRAADARKALEYRAYDFVLCELNFIDELYSGQDLLDDLRRNQLLPFSTVFIIVTAEATYRHVAEAAESALDSFMLKPFTPAQLAKRLFQSRNRKNTLKDIFLAMEEQRFVEAAKLCLRRFHDRDKYWLYSARLGAELLLRLGRPTEAQNMFKAIVEAKTLPWAKLGVARAQLELGQTALAVGTLENLISDEPQFVDAYDVMGRAHFEQGKIDLALETYTMAAMLAPHSIGRQQTLAMITFYAGDHQAAERLLERTVRNGLDSKMFDAQVLVLLAFSRLEKNDIPGLLRCRDDVQRLMEKSPEPDRLQRLHRLREYVSALLLIGRRQFAECVTTVRSVKASITQAEFDFESAGNLLGVLCQMTNQAIVLEEIDSLVDTIGMRFCSNRALTELLFACARSHPPYAERMRTCQTKVLQFSEAALSLSMSGNPTRAVQELLRGGRETFNARLLDNANQVLQKHAEKITDADTLTAEVQDLRTRYAMNSARPVLGDAKGRGGGLSLDHFATRRPPDPAPA